MRVWKAWKLRKAKSQQRGTHEQHAGGGESWADVADLESGTGARRFAIQTNDASNSSKDRRAVTQARANHM